MAIVMPGKCIYQISEPRFQNKPKNVLFSKVYFSTKILRISSFRTKKLKRLNFRKAFDKKANNIQFQGNVNDVE